MLKRIEDNIKKDDKNEIPLPIKGKVNLLFAELFFNNGNNEKALEYLNPETNMWNSLPL